MVSVQAREEKSKPRCDVALNPTTIKLAEAEAVVYNNSVKHSEEEDQEYKQIKVSTKLFIQIFHFKHYEINLHAFRG